MKTKKPVKKLFLTGFYLTILYNQLCTKYYLGHGL